MEMKKLLLAAACVAAMTGMAEEVRPIEETLPPAEGWSAVGFAFAPVRCLQYPSVESDVDGLRLALVAAHHRQVNGVDIGVLGSWADGEINGLSFSGIGNWCDGASFGLHVSSVMNYSSGTFNGLHFALVNSGYDVSGAQFGLVNCVSEGRGFQVGLWNLAECWRGIQIGLVNMSMSYSGVQIGLGNIIGESPLTACLFLNAWF